jgi:hypothetical protein
LARPGGVELGQHGAIQMHEADDAGLELIARLVDRECLQRSDAHPTGVVHDRTYVIGDLQDVSYGLLDARVERDV